jgi:uncharacterized glyoxalase superfamily protein PhnB
MVHEHNHDHDEHDHDHDHEHEFEVGPRHFFGVVPVFLVDNVEDTVSHYRDVMGFEVDFLYGTPATYASVSRDDAIINFTLSDPLGRRNSVRTAGTGNGVDAYLVVADVDDVYIEFQENGANVVEPIASYDYGMREFGVEDINGYRLTIAEETDDA